MALTEQDLTNLEISDSVGDFGRNSKVGDAVEELRALRQRVAELEGSPNWAEFRRVKHLADAAAKAVDALESIGEQAWQRSVDLAAGLHEACDRIEGALEARTPDTVRWRLLADMAAPKTPARSDLLAPEEWARRTRLAWWADLSDEHRLALIEQCCPSCGALDLSCRCGDGS